MDSWTGILQIVIDFALKGAVICAAARLLTMLLRNTSACIRNRIWAFTFVGLLVLPVFSIAGPVLKIPILPDLHSVGLAGGVDAGSSHLTRLALEGLSGTKDPGSDTAAGGDAIPSFGTHWSHWALLCLAIGSCITFLWILAWRLHIRRIVRSAETLQGSWNERCADLSRHFKLSRRVQVLKSERIKTGMTLGILRPLIILPEDAESWNEQRRHLVIAHEMAHIKRHDALMEELASIVTVLYWYNPLVWMALSRLRIERERDCDNAVLRSGVKPSDYAMQLMEMAEDVSNNISLAWQPVGISQNSNLKDRLLHILNPNIRRGAMGRRASLITGILLILLILPLSVLGVWGRGESELLMSQVELPAKSALYWSEVENPDASAAYNVECVLNDSGLTAALHLLRNLAAQSKSHRSHYIDENEFNLLGYRYLYDNKVSEAIAIFEMNVSMFPKSWNVYDSLGEALYLAGEYESSYENFKQSLKIGSKNIKGAQKFMQQIEETRRAAVETVE